MDQGRGRQSTIILTLLKGGVNSGESCLDTVNLEVLWFENTAPTSGNRRLCVRRVTDNGNTASSFPRRPIAALIHWGRPKFEIIQSSLTHSSILFRIVPNDAELVRPYAHADVLTLSKLIPAIQEVGKLHRDRLP